MRYEASIRVYDVMGEMVIMAQIWRSPEFGEQRPVPLASTHLSVPGIGETDPERWLKRALVFLLEEDTRAPLDSDEEGRPGGSNNHTVMLRHRLLTEKIDGGGWGGEAGGEPPKESAEGR